MGYQWYNAQLHNHTRHSDGKYSVEETIDNLMARGARMLALTDHNAAAGNEEFLKLCREKGIVGIRGNEISTYYGHVVGLGIDEYLDWRYYTPENPEAIFDDIHKRGGLCGYAHPIRIGYPLVPGCSWLFHIRDYAKIDYYEILNTGDYYRSRNDQVIEDWLYRLREGFLHLGATSGLDYHGRPYHGHEYVTYVALEEDRQDREQAAMESIRNQHMIVCKDELILFTLEMEDGRRRIPGERIGGGPAKLIVEPSSPDAMPAHPLVAVDDQEGTKLYDGCEGIRLRPNTFAVVRLYDGSFDFDHLVAVTNPFHV